MLKLKTEYKLLLLILILNLAFQIYFSFQTPAYSSDTAYYHLRHIDYILDNAKPIFFDELSYGGRIILDPHIFHYFLALFALISPLALKIVPAFLIMLTSVFVFLLARKLTGSWQAALFSSLISSFIPILLEYTLNQISIYGLTVLLMLWAVYIFTDIKKRITLFAILMFILPLTQPLNIIIPISFLFFITLLSLEGQSPEKPIKEAVLFSIFITLLLNLIVFKRAFLEFGIEAIWQNIPAGLLANYFKDISIADAVYKIGVLPLIIGAFGLSWGLAKEKNNLALLLGAFILADIVLLLLKLIPFAVGLLYLGIMLAVTSSITFEKLLSYLSITKFARYKGWITFAFVGIVAISIIIPSAITAQNTIEHGISEGEIEALEWIKENTPQESLILGDVYEGHAIAAIANRKNVIDSNFIFAPDRYNDVVEAYRTESVIRAMQLLRKYKADYIYLSEKTKERYDIKYLKYAVDKDCFEVQFENEDVEVYEVKC